MIERNERRVKRSISAPRIWAAKERVGMELYRSFGRTRLGEECAQGKEMLTCVTAERLPVILSFGGVGGRRKRLDKNP